MNRREFLKRFAVGVGVGTVVITKGRAVGKSEWPSKVVSCDLAVDATKFNAAVKEYQRLTSIRMLEIMRAEASSRWRKS